MLKLAGCVLLLGCAGAVQAWTVLEHRRELDVLAGLRAAFGQMGESIRLDLTPMPRLLERLARRGPPAVREFFAAVTADLARGRSLDSSWREAVPVLNLDGEENALLLDLRLTGDEEAVTAQLDHAVRALEEHLGEKRKKRREKEKLSAAVSFSAALLLILLLI